MGQNQIKAGLVIRHQARTAVDQVTSKLSSVTQLKSLTYDQFLHELQLLNQITDELTKSSDKTVHFSIQQGGERNLMWKISTRIVCEKVVRSSGAVLTSKLLSVRRFIRLYDDIMHQLSAVSSASVSAESDPPLDQGGDLCASMIIDGLDTASITSEDVSLSECCICMDRGCDVILPCTHGFCEDCINQWKTTVEASRLRNRDSTCPICRNPLDDASHHWVLPETDTPTPDEMPALILGLVDRAEGRERASTHSTSSSDQAIGLQGDGLVTSSIADGYTLVSHNVPVREPQ